MRQMKKKIIIAIIVTLILTAAIAFVVSSQVIKGKEEEIQELQAQVVDTTCLAFSKDLKADSIITQDDITEVKIKLTSLASGTYKVSDGNVKHMITDDEGSLIESTANADLNLTKEDFVGRVVKANVSKNTLILDSLLYSEGEEPTKDERIQEFNFIQIPSDVNVKDYIDIRIQFSAGEDYSVLIGKKVEKIAGENTIFIKMNEEEIMTMGSAVIEAYMQQGVRLYAIKYTDPATQLFDEKIVDYVAKYEYAVEKLINEKTDLELKKLFAQKLVTDGTYAELTTGEYIDGEEKIVGTANIMIQSGDTILANGESVNNQISLLIAENEDEELYVASSSWELVPQSMKDELLENNPSIKDFELEELENEMLAKYAGIEEEYIEEIKLADANKDENILSYYKMMRVQTRDEIIRTYPVKEEVLKVIKNNPNLLEEVIAEFDTTALLNTKVDEYKELEAEYNAAMDEYTKQEIKQKMEELMSERTQNVEEKMKEQIEAQRAERISYLESLVGETSTEI